MSSDLTFYLTKRLLLYQILIETGNNLETSRVHKNKEKNVEWNIWKD